MEKKIENIDEMIDDEVVVTSASESQYSADKRLIKRMNREERIRSRIWELDFLRGICVILMVFDHFMYDIAYMFGELWYNATGNIMFFNMTENAIAYWDSTIRMVVRPLVVLCFFLLCGISCSFSRSNFKRGAILLGASALLSAVTIAIGQPIIFGVLHMLSISILIIALIELCCRGNKKAYVITSAVLGVLVIITNVIISNVGVTPNNALAWLSRAFKGKGFVSLDYFPLLPNLGIVLLGAALGPILYPKRRTLFSRLDTHFRWYRPFNFCGRHAAWFYLFHQVVWFLAFALFTIIAIPGGWDIIVYNFLS